MTTANLHPRAGTVKYQSLTGDLWPRVKLYDSLPRGAYSAVHLESQ